MKVVGPGGKGPGRLDPYLDPYPPCFLCLMRLFVVLDERG
jgi:hypothetical protein